MSRIGVCVVTGLVSLALAVLLPGTPTSLATDVATLQAQLADGHVRVEQLHDELAQHRSQLAELRREELATRAGVRARMVTIYKTGGVHPLSQLASGRSMDDVASAADTLGVVVDHDHAELQRAERLVTRIHRLENTIDQTRRQLTQAKRDVARSEREIAAARAREAAAKRRLAEMARVDDSPLIPRAVAPETITSIAAGSSDAAATATPAASFSQTGIASVYHDSFAGQQTANGDRYDPGAMTAAHPSLPLGSWVLVTGPAGSALVRINDRGPFVGGRIIDLSRAAGNAVGVNGLGTVTITVQ